MSAVFGILAGVVGGAIALLLVALLVGWLAGVVSGARGSGWQGIAIAVVASAWGLAAFALLASLPILLGAWIADAQQVVALTGRVAGYSLWPAVLGLPLCFWLGGVVSRWRYDAG